MKYRGLSQQQSIKHGVLRGILANACIKIFVGALLPVWFPTQPTIAITALWYSPINQPIRD